MLTCPSCGTPEKTLVKICHSCGEAFANEDLLELQKLNFLIEETAAWDIPEKLRRPYRERLVSLKKRLLQHLKVPVAETAPVVELEPIPVPFEAPPEKKESKPAKEKVPFDQWLLSARNINIALYTGGVLLILAGLIFIGVNWTRIPGLGKFAIMLLVTGLMYLGGYLLFRNPAYKIGGVALIAIASGFITLNFAVLQIYVLRQIGLSDNMMWLIASLVCLLLYGITSYLTRNMLFTFYTQAALISGAVATLLITDATIMTYLVVSAGIALAFLLIAWFVKASTISEFTYKPFLIVANLGMPAVVLISGLAWIINQTCISCTAGSPWLAIMALGLGVIFYLITILLFGWKITRWIAVPLLALTLTFILYQLDLSATAIGITLHTLSVIFLLGGSVLERREDERSGTWPIYITAYLVAAYVTLLALLDPDDLIKVLFGDVVILAVSGVIFRQIRFMYATVWLLIWPVYLLINQNISSQVSQGLWLAGLGLVYTAVGYISGRPNKKWSGPTLSAAAFLSPIVIIMVWPDKLISSLSLLVFAILYLLLALWLNWNWLLLPGLVGLNLALFTWNDLMFPILQIRNQTLIFNYEVLGILSVFGAYLLQRLDQDRWSRPLYITGLLNIIGAYIAGLFSLDWVAVIISGTSAAISLTFAWLKREEIKKVNAPPFLTYLGLLILFGSQYYLYHLIGTAALNNWPIYSVFLCTVFVILAWLMPRESLINVYSTPLWYTGLALMVVPLAGSLDLADPFLGTITFAVAGLTYLGVGFWKKIEPYFITYLGLLILFGSQYYLFDIIGGSVQDNWPLFTAAACALYVFLAWLMDHKPATSVISTPFQFTGLILLIIPLLGSLILADPVLGAITFSVAGIICAGVGLWRKKNIFYYLSIAALVGVILEIFIYLKISETQAYVIPIGLALIVIGWLENLQEKKISYQILTYLGLFILLGSALLQSIPRGEYIYAILLGCECLIAVWVGIKQHLRGYVQIGVIALFINAIVQFGPGFIEMPRWIQIGVTGTILLGGGLAALFKREEILSIRKNLADEMKSWEP